MKRYVLFGGAAYYAMGGWHDFAGYYETLGEASAEGRRREGDERWFDWWHVVDTSTGEIVAKSECQAHGAPDAPPID